MKKITLLLLMCFASVSLFAQTFTGTTGPISDNVCDATHDFPVTVSGVGVLGTTNNFSSVGFSITHTWDSDLSIYLVAPDGTTIVELSTGNGGNGDGYLNTVISTTGATAITAGTAPFTGTYSPEGSFAVLDGIDADGTWILRVCDTAAGDTGSVDAWSITFDPVPLSAPSCVANPVSTPNATCGNFASSISWDAADTATGYYLTIGTTSGGTDIVNNEDVGVVLTYNLPSQTAGTTYFWTVVPYNGVGSATGCTENSYTTFATGCYCVSLPTSNDGLGITNVLLGTTNVPNGDVTYFDHTATVVDFAQGVSAITQITFATGYTYDTNIWIDFNDDLDFDDAGELVQTGIASTNANPTTLDASFVMPVAAPLGQHRMRIGTADDGQVPPASCYSGAWGVTLDYTVNIIVQPVDLPDYANLQYPYSETVTVGGSITVYGRVYEGGLTDTTSGQAPGINAWVGYSTTDANPNTFTNWVPATFNVETDGDNNDEYQATIGASLPVGTYYYATRFQLNGGAFVYGGTNFGFWNGTDKINGVLTITPPPAPNNDECAGAIVLTPGGVFGDNDIDGTNFGATLSTNNPAPSCGTFNFATVGKDVWYSVDVPASGSLTIETSTNGAGSGMDTVISVYTGDCSVSPLTAVNCDDDGATETTFGLSRLSLTGLNPGTLLIRLFGYNGSQGSYSISAYDASLGNGSFDSTNFTYYPNPVKNILNLSYNQEISNVEVYNLLGQKVSSNVINANDANIDMSNLSKGAYMVRVTSNDQVKTIKVIKE